MCSHLWNLTLSCQLVYGQSCWKFRRLHWLHNVKTIKIPCLLVWDTILEAFCHYVQSNVAGRTVTSFPRCLLVRVVECLNKPSSSTSMYSGDTIPVTWTTAMSVEARYSLFSWVILKHQVTVCNTVKHNTGYMERADRKLIIRDSILKERIPLDLSSLDSRGQLLALTVWTFWSTATTSSSPLASMITAMKKKTWSAKQCGATVQEK